METKKSENLKESLQKLLEQHPELKHATVVFSGDSFSFSESDVKQQAASGISECEIREPEPESLNGCSPKVGVRKSAVHGYGVFAREVIEAGELIEESKLLKLGWRRHYTKDPVLYDYVWVNKSCNCRECEEHGSNQYIALGLGSLYNHADEPNTVLKTNFRTEVITIRASKRIEQGAEVFVSYGKKYFLIRDFWRNVEKNNTFEKFLENKKMSGNKEGL